MFTKDLKTFADSKSHIYYKYDDYLIYIFI